MASNTERLSLLKKDPIADALDTFNIETMLNENWDKIDDAVKGLDVEIDNTLDTSKNYTNQEIAKTVLKTELSSTNANRGASIVGLRDVNGHIEATNVENAIAELYQKSGIYAYQSEPLLNLQPEGKIWRLSQFDTPTHRMKIGSKKYDVDLNSLLTEFPSAYVNSTGNYYNAGAFYKNYEIIDSNSSVDDTDTVTLGESYITLYVSKSGGGSSSAVAGLRFPYIDWTNINNVSVRISNAETGTTYDLFDISARQDGPSDSSIYVEGTRDNINSTITLDVSELNGWGNLLINVGAGGTTSQSRRLGVRIHSIILS